MDELPVYAIAFGQHERAMPSVDLASLRAQLMQLGWVEDARVSRRLPDTLIIDIVERKPAAVWQNKGKLALIDVNGKVLQPVNVSAMRSEEHTSELQSLMRNSYAVFCLKKKK